MKIGLGGTITVNAQERWYTALRAGQAFGGTVFHSPAAANNGHIQLMNPAASGVFALVYAAMYDSSEASIRFNLTFYNTPLTTNDGTVFNLRSGSAAPQCQVRRQDNVGVLGSVFSSLELQINNPFTSPIWLAELDAGEGLNVVGVSLAFDIEATFLWIELPV